MPNILESLGNHEFDNGISGLTPFIESLACPILAANLDLTHVPELSKQSNLKRSVIFNVSGYGIGIIGYITPDTKRLAIPNLVTFLDEIDTIKEEVKRLRFQGVKIIIALGHSGYLNDQNIAREVEGIDLIVGGHNHKFLWSGTTPDEEESAGPYPTYVKQKSGKEVPIVHAYAFTKYLGSIRVNIDSDDKIIELRGNPILLDKSIAQDSHVLGIVKRYKRKAEKYLSKIIGNTSVTLDGHSCEKAECNLGNLITDAIVECHASKTKGEHWTDAPIAVIQGGGIKSSLSITTTELPAPITKEDLLNVLPFTDRLVKVEMNGRILLQMLEHSISKYDKPRSREFLQVSGLKIVYDPIKPIGSRVINALARCWFCEIPKYSLVDSRQIYTVLMPDFLHDGGDGYGMLKNLNSQLLPYNAVQCTEEYFNKHYTIFPEIEHRITII